MADSKFTPPTNAPVGPAKAIDLAYQVKTIRHALIIGLSSYAEIERLENDYEMLKEYGNTPTDGRLKPIGQVDFANIAFADALAALEALADGVAA